jgi:hypothetical protein
VFPQNPHRQYLVIVELPRLVAYTLLWFSPFGRTAEHALHGGGTNSVTRGFGGGSTGRVSKDSFRVILESWFVLVRFLLIVFIFDS